MRETRIYDSNDGWLRKDEIWHGASESYLISSTFKRNDCFSRVRRWQIQPKTFIMGDPEKEGWLAKTLQRAKNNGHLK
jgi:hypothetical protein